jgi:PAS domain S-box-containing protein
VRENELFAMLEGAGDAAFVVGQDGLIRFWNRSAERLLGLGAAETLDRHCAAVLEGADSSGARFCAPECTVMEIARRSTEISAYDLEVKTAAGARKWVSVSVIVAEAGPKQGRLLVHLLRDIDARKRLENLTKEIVVHVGRLTGQQADALVSLGRAPVPTIELTAQEQRILELLSIGHATATISQELHISPVTVRNHVQHILRKLGAHTRLEAVIRAVRERLI